MNELLVNATPIGAKQASGKIRVSSMPYSFDIYEGHSKRRFQNRKNILPFYRSESSK